MGKSERDRRAKKQIEYRDINPLVLPLVGKRWLPSWASNPKASNN